MDKDKLNARVQRVSNFSSAISSVASLVNPLFLTVPIVCSVVNELCIFFEKERVEARFDKLEKKLEEHDIGISEFVEKVKSLDEHNSYALRNNLKHLCLSALPETVDLLNEAMIELVMSENHSLPELCCEVIRQLNANDVELLNNILNHLLEDSRPSYEKAKQKQDETQMRKAKIHDRNVIYGGRTILWDDFSLKYSSEGEKYSIPFEHYINAKIVANGIDAENYLLYIGQSLLKLQGV